MKTKLELNKFFQYTHINYEEDIYKNCYHEWERFDNEVLVNRIPKKFAKNLTKELIESDEDLREKVELSLNQANEDALLNEAHSAQDKAVEKYADKLADYINNLCENNNKAINYIAIDWNNNVAIIDFNVKEALTVTREIINGEGMFYYEDNLALATVYDGNNKQARAVEHHLHYLLNADLIDKIYSIIGYPRFNWEVDYYDATEEMFEERLKENIPARYFDIRDNVNKAINYYKKIEKMNEETMKNKKELESILKEIKPAEKRLYEKIIKNKKYDD